MQALLLRLFFIRDSKNNRTQSAVRQHGNTSRLSDRTCVGRWSRDGLPCSPSLEKLTRLFFFGESRWISRGHVWRLPIAWESSTQGAVLFSTACAARTANGDARPEGKAAFAIQKNSMRHRPHPSRERPAPGQALQPSSRKVMAGLRGRHLPWTAGEPFGAFLCDEGPAGRRSARIGSRGRWQALAGRCTGGAAAWPQGLWRPRIGVAQVLHRLCATCLCTEGREALSLNAEGWTAGPGCPSTIYRQVDAGFSGRPAAARQRAAGP